MVTTATRTFQTGARLSFAGRAALLGLVLFCEKFALNFLVDFHATVAATGLGATIRVAQHAGFRFAVAFGVSLALLAYARADGRWRQLNEAARGAALHPGWFALHAGLVLPLAPLSYFLYGHRGAPLSFGTMALLWLLFALAAVGTLLRALAPWRLWREAGRTLGVLWLYAALAAALAASAMQWSEALWRPTAAVTFDAVWQVLRPFIPSLQSNSSTLVLSSSRFAVQVSDVCSGLEGAGLLLTFCCAWLLCFRGEYIFPRALILLPLGLALSFALNVLRIATLMLIGYAGYPQMAIYGFHSQAGWIAFNCAAGLIAFASRRSAWLSRSARERGAAAAPAAPTANVRAGTPLAAPAASSVPATLPVPSTATAENPTAAYLLPFLAILAAGMIARALSSGFESLYALRLIAAAAAIAAYWRTLRRLDWRCSWRGPLAGLVIFALWIGVASVLTRPIAMPAALAAMPESRRVLWLIARVAAALITVPIAEELAFRGYLLRRLVAADFQAIRFSDVGVTALILSSLLFGLEHGVLWLPGALAGLVYGALLMRTGRMGEAVAAHVATNGLLAAYVLTQSQWQLW